MKILKNITYKNLENISGIIKVKKIYILPILHLGLSQRAIAKIDTTNFIFPGKKNWDRFFSKKINHKGLQKLENVYFSKEPLEELLYEYVDYFEETDTYLYVKVGEKNGYLLDPKEYFKLYSDPSSFSIC